ncbi:MAG: hypothetical protein A2513_11225 [Sulfurimonas sp. RIFOXYD12_FULL_33_39]|uniref:hypothetical protein n=1 Tax=unclassified Sulfurimonas TaxID=2623549 RepID=UPI0008B72A8E|nr:MULTISPECIES: hypothetical protein [unclassified Sulfurimonas]OHE05394.1 MAG: hypothetical protein A3G74_08040 [Sulfurimonas sp. RIFCSPLOWO2_12_FULL_34_6]OHE09868.1 MAG: hypothetical protein A2513_11225 [Sulfurimonas sp. RIFOXYD12_FULL_33_39]OHE13624.1 MAG: hypothetical protein A2530_08530 [Sulfurimonas sp. RIFOXYD2_FULL_34_21]DAB27353.1 MAG TPA: hypothetical protein CFH78_08205 [Sulfurimonas sp. UBA10385]
MSVKKALIFGFFTAFLVLGILSMQRAVPETKEDRIYKAIKVYSPYILEKRIGGLTIIDKRDGTKEKPSAADVFHRLDELEEKWGREHLRVEYNDVLILGENNQTVARVFIETQKERDFIKRFYGI